MDAGAVTLIALVVFAWGLSSARLGRADMSAPALLHWAIQELEGRKSSGERRSR
jgi:hypothetical protein